MAFAFLSPHEEVRYVLERKDIIMKTNQIMIRPMGDFKVIQRTKDAFFNATDLLKQWNGLKGNTKSIENFYIDNRAFLQDMNYQSIDNNEDIYFPYHIFVVFAKWLSSDLFVYAFNLCEDDDERMININRLIDSEEYSILKKYNYKHKDARSYHTYVMKDRSGLFKIGKSEDVRRRIKKLSVGNSSIELVCEINRDVESELHKCFKSKRVRGEWFSLSNDDISLIKENWCHRKYPNVLPI